MRKGEERVGGRGEQRDVVWGWRGGGRNGGGRETIKSGLGCRDWPALFGHVNVA